MAKDDEKDNTTSVPITQLSGLRINYKGENSSFSVPSMTLAQQALLVNNLETSEDGKTNITPIIDGTIVYISDTSTYQVFSNGGWRVVQLGAAGDTVTTAVIGAAVPGAIATWSDDTGTVIGESKGATGYFTQAANLVVNNTGGNGIPIPSEAGQLLVFSGLDGSTIIPAKNNNGDNVKLINGALAVQAFTNSRRKQASKKGGASPASGLSAVPDTLSGFSGIDIVDFSDYGLLTVNERQFVTMQFDPTFVPDPNNPDVFANQNILITDDDISTDPASYGAILEVRSNKAAMIVPCLTTAATTAIVTKGLAVPGMIAYDTNQNALVYSTGGAFAQIGGSEGGGINQIVNGTGIMVSGTGTESSVTITNVGVTSIANGANITISGGTQTAGKYTGDITIAASGGGGSSFPSLTLTNGNTNSTVLSTAANSKGAPFIFPAIQGTAGQILSSSDNEGNTSWIAAGSGSGNVVGPQNGVTQNTIPVWSSATGTAIGKTSVVISDLGNNISTTGSITASNGMNTSSLSIMNGSNSLTLDTSVNEDYSFVFPATQGEVGQVLSLTDVSTGIMGWANVVAANWIFVTSTGNLNQLTVTNGVSGNGLNSVSLVSPTDSSKGDRPRIDFATGNNTVLRHCTLRPSTAQTGDVTFTLPNGPPVPNPSSGNMVPILMDINGTMGFDNGIQAVGGGLQLTGALTVNGTKSFVEPDSGGGYFYVNQTEAEGTQAALNTNLVSIICPNGRVVALEFDAISSIQVKDVLERGESVIKEATEKLKDISVVKYCYKDKVSEGNGKYYGVIAEELREVMPELVGDNLIRFVPNIMAKGVVTGWTPTIKDTARAIVVTFDEQQDLNILIDKKIKLYFDKGELIGKIIVSTNEYLNIELDQEILISELPKEVFVYGSEENCPSVSKGRLAELNLIVIQSLINKIEILENKLGVK